MSCPGQRVQVDVKVVSRACIADPELRLFQYAAIDEFTRRRFLAAYPKQSAYSSAHFLRKLRMRYARRGMQVECVQTDNDFEFTNRFSNSKRDLPTLFEKTATQLGARHRLIRLIRRATRQGGALPPRGPEALLSVSNRLPVCIHGWLCIGRASNNRPMRPFQHSPLPFLRCRSVQTQVCHACCYFISRSSSRYPAGSNRPVAAAAFSV